MCINMMHVSFRRGSGSVKVEDMSYSAFLCFTNPKSLHAEQSPSCLSAHFYLSWVFFLSAVSVLNLLHCFV